MNTKYFDKNNRELTETEFNQREAGLIMEKEQAAYIARRAQYLDGYRKYQAAVNYGEFERVTAVDSFIESLRNKNWSVLNGIPSQIKYFTGEVGFAASGLIRRMGG